MDKSYRRERAMDPNSIKKLINKGTLYDLGMEYYVGMPHHPNHPPFAFSLTKVHGDVVYEGGVSAANCMFTTGGHTGTHFDAHGHISKGGKVYNVGDIEPWQGVQGLKRAGIEKVFPIVTRGVLLDIANLEGISCLGSDYKIGEKQLQEAEKRQNVTVGQGDVALIRTGWVQHFEDPRKYISHDEGCPGLEVSGAKWLIDKGVFCAGSDTLAFENTPSASYPVHVLLLVENGIHIMEVLNLEKLASDKEYEFLFMVSPLKIRGGTGSPVRPIAIV
jgi:kynurenine formamidase